MIAPTLWVKGDSAFPGWLAKFPSSPKQLYALGHRATLDATCVAIVGTRAPTDYGARTANALASALARRGACVVSGLAMGIDGIAHRAALQASGRTAAVLGTGIDEIYPRVHHRLYHDIAQRGVVLSEFEPGRKAFRGCFPRRNRIIAGLASLTIVVEAGQKSGALITAMYAAEMGNQVAAVPGPIDSPQSAGANQLLRDGAHVIASIDDALTLAGLGVARSTAATLLQLTPDEGIVWNALGAHTLTPDELVARTGFDASRCLIAITNLEVRGLIESLLTGELRRR